MKLTIGQVAHQAGVGVETIRFYEREGLIDEPPRRDSGYRQYSPDVVTRILFIKRAKELGFSLKEIQELLLLRVDPESTCVDVKRQTEVKIADVERKIEDLLRMKQALVKVANLCSGDGPLSACPILDALDTIPLT
jgi:MerR family transcriptional regulator, copper efflux regulator